MMGRNAGLFAVLAAGLLAPAAGAADLELELGPSGRSAADWREPADRLAARIQRLAAPAGLPSRIDLARGGHLLPAPQGRAPGPLSLVFDSSGDRAFPASYRQLLQDAFAEAASFLTVLLGTPPRAGAVRVLNYDADISDRQAVGGAYYVDNAPAGPEIRFPVYQSSAAAAVNFIHTLALAWRGPNPYPLEAWNEGAARAATMQVARSAGALPASVDADSVEAALASTYDATEAYDWQNQPALSGPAFIAPNLLNQPLPVGGSTGGIFLARHQMAGTAFLKVLAERPLFFRALNERFDIAPAVDEAGLLMMGQLALDQLAGFSPGTVEGLTLAPWVRRQHILDSRLAAGTKLLLQPTALEAAPGTSDFGVFSLVLNAFRVDSSANETLLSGESFPLYIGPNGDRFFTSAQDDRAELLGGFGSVAPNFPADSFAGAPYAVRTAFPFGGQAAEAFLPAGGFSDGVNFSPASFYGTALGFAVPSGARLEVEAAWAGGRRTSLVQNGAFGDRITDEGFLRTGSVDVSVYLVNGASKVLLVRRRVNKGPGRLAVNLEPDEARAAASLSLLPRLALIGIPLAPDREEASRMLGIDPGRLLAARFDPVRGRYLVFPEEGRIQRGIGAFIRPEAAATVQIEGRRVPGRPVIAHLQPGWNLVANPGTEALSLSAIMATSATESLLSYPQAAGDVLGITAFGFAPDPADPDQGSLVEATVIPAGGAVFMRALRAEGAVVILPASAPDLRPVFRLGRPERAAPQARSGSFLWESRLKLSRWGRPAAEARFGQAMGASRRMDLRWDSGLPLSPAGPQAFSLGSEPLYRDMRGWGTSEAWTIRLTGLQAGDRCRIDFEPIAGRRDFIVSGIGRDQRIGGRGRIDFWASSETMELTIRAGSGS